MIELNRTITLESGYFIVESAGYRSIALQRKRVAGQSLTPLFFFIETNSQRSTVYVRNGSGTSPADGTVFTVDVFGFK